MSKDKVKVTKANYRLQQKVGAGPLDTKAVEKSQSVIDNNQVDFAPLGLSILKKLSDVLDLARAGKPPSDIKHVLTTSIMELKAHAALFHYTLITTLANIMLNFLETITHVDEDAIEIIQAHQDTLHMIIVRELRGGGGDAGRKLTQELQQVCDRYYAKNLNK